MFTSRLLRQLPRTTGMSVIAALGGLLALGSLACTNDSDYRDYQATAAARTWELGGVKLHVELADSDEERQQGLMYRKSLPDDHGMLFVYPKVDVRRFWMKNTQIPLSIAFMEESGKNDGKGTIVNIEDMQPFAEVTSGISLKPVRLALEMNQGWFSKHNLKNGDTIALPDWLKTVIAEGN